MSDSAQQGSDFNAYSAPLEFRAGEDTIEETISSLLIDDSLAEDTETFRLQITEADSEIDQSAGGAITINIRDDDSKFFWAEK